jgi:hypothetical protein
MNFARIIKAAVAMYEAPTPLNALELVVAVLEEVLPFLPDDALKPLLDDAARRRADAIADAAQAAKFGA